MSQDIDPVALYVGIDGDAAIAARDHALSTGEYHAVETVQYHPGVLRYADPAVVAAFKPEEALSVDQSEIERLTLALGEAQAGNEAFESRLQVADQTLAERDKLIGELKGDIERLSNIVQVEVPDAEMQQRLAAVTAERDNLAAQLDAASKGGRSKTK